MSRLLSFQKLNNIRDLGGMKTCDGRVIRSGMLLRSGHLSKLDPSDLADLRRLVDVVIDLRTDAERQENPDTVMEGVSYEICPVVDRLTAGVTREREADREIFLRFLSDPQGAKEYMCGLYRNFLEKPALSAYRRFLGILLQSSEKTVLWHCTAGKDRAGIASALIEEILGVPREAVREDYLITNEYLAGDIAFLTGFVRKQAGVESGIADDALRYLLGADEDYIDIWYGEIEKRFGTFSRFVSEGMSLSEENVETLKERYLTNAISSALD